MDTQDTAAQNKKQEAAPVPEKQTNCLGCGKPIMKLKRYYRDGKFYCNKKCWQKKVKAKPQSEESKEKK